MMKIYELINYRGMSMSEAENKYLQLTKSLELYGVDMYSVLVR